ncbi:MAG: hypothetical protein LBC31_00075 [Treponema sp.]|jgi:hypothetical protein|nr:hypothetical protein [Treponema sp.]
MNKKAVLTRKTFRLIAAYSRLPHEGRAILDQLVGYLAEGMWNCHKTKKKTVTAAAPKVQFLEQPPV